MKTENLKRLVVHVRSEGRTGLAANAEAELKALEASHAEMIAALKVVLRSGVNSTWTDEDGARVSMQSVAARALEKAGAL